MTSDADNGDFIHVVVAVLVDCDDRVLIAQRPCGRHLAGGWEFPGGKLEPGEARFAGLKRELMEELGIRVQSAHPLICVRHEYPDRKILLDVWSVEVYHGSPIGLEGQALRWCARERLADEPLLAADRPIVNALRLPTILRSIDAVSHPLRGVICDASAGVASAADRGADFVALSRPLSGQDLARACASVNLPVFASGIALHDAWESGAIGLYRPEGSDR